MKFRTIIILALNFIFLNCSHSSVLNNTNIVNKENLQSHIQYLTDISPSRNYQNLISLNSIADYIDSTFRQYSSDVQQQTFQVQENEYKNIFCSFGPRDQEHIVVGAHYDVCGEQPGADDNASAIAGLLELARMLKTNAPDLKYGIDLVAYSLEEPPFFRTDQMGSAVHAKSLKDSKSKIKIMICLEMIGYYSDQPKSQQFPIGILKWFYPTTGDFIAVVSNFKSSCIASRIKKTMKRNSEIKVVKLTAPTFLPGIDFSDHRNYWKHGYKAVMITDTAFYRNPNYHELSDTIQSLDFNRMAEVVKGVYAVLIDL